METTKSSTTKKKEISAAKRSIRAEIGGYADDGAPRRREEEVLM
jgi:hypothetical protein